MGASNTVVSAYTMYILSPINLFVLELNPFPNDKFWTIQTQKSLQTTILSLKWCKVPQKGRKLCGKKEKLLIMTNFCFPYSEKTCSADT